MSAFQSFSASNSTPESRAQALRLVRAMMGKTLGYFEDREEAQLKQFRVHLLDLADSKLPLLHSQNLRTAAMLLDRQATAFNRLYRDALQQTLNEEVRAVWPEMEKLGAKPVPLTDHALDGMTLSLIDLDEVHRILLLDRVAQQFNNHYDATLAPLTQKLGALFGIESPSVSTNPFRPEILLRAFMIAWEKGEFDPQVTEHLVQALEPAHTVNLAPLYTDLGATLAQAGIQAQTVHRIRKSVSSAYAPLTGSAPLSEAGAQSSQAPLQSAPAPLSRGNGGAPSSPAAFAPEPARSAWSALAPAGQHIATQVKAFLQRLGVGSTAAGPQGPGAAAGPAGRGQVAYGGGGDMGGGGMQAGAPEDFDGSTQGQQYDYVPGQYSGGAPADPALLNYLGQMQAGAGLGQTSSRFQFLQPQEDGPGHHNVLRQIREQEEIRQAPELDRGTVDALAEVFDYVFADQAIPSQMKVVIGRLQIPVLRAAMMDRDFFLSSEHPARKLVDTLASSSVAWTPEKGEEDPLYVRIEHTVQRVLSEFDDDLTLFSLLLAEFTEFLFESEQQAQQQIEPVADVQRDEEALNAALAHADEIIHARISALPDHLPLVPFLKPFLTTEWRQVIAAAWMLEDNEPGRWNAALQTMDQLIWSTQPKTTSEERKELVAVLPELVRILNVELDAIAWYGDPRATFTRRLIGTHMLAIRMKAPPPIDTQSAALEESAGDAAMEALDQRRATQLTVQDPAAMDDFDASAQLLTRGVWFEVAEPDATPHRCRLSWVSPMRTRFLFTNREGFDAFVRSEREVANMLRMGHLQLLDQAPIVERALNQLMAGNEEELRLQA
ncbi:DUF1631 family protein [Rhodoferax saidenbachensis]|uniref:Thymidine phosphorylase n=1 Tax=Rhodoferax saidenbachensis TaxID=1484693 RepID=A0ABU1ZHC4_9BURK|nr:DUF1631 family protein [Rhodoferax saidenbachensis]MDR7304803.1 hypothetical protein [Rhodoferax saidenbachensis]